MGKILRVDLTNGKIREEFPNEETLKLYLRCKENLRLYGKDS